MLSGSAVSLEPSAWDIGLFDEPAPFVGQDRFSETGCRLQKMFGESVGFFEALESTQAQIDDRAWDIGRRVNAKREAFLFADELVLFRQILHELERVEGEPIRAREDVLDDILSEL